MSITDDLIQHAMHRMGKVLSDTTDLLETNEDVLKLYAMTYCFALASLNKGLGEMKPLYGKLSQTQRVGVLAVAARKTLDIPDDNDPQTKAQFVQYLSDTAAAVAEIRPLFRFQVVFEEDDK